LTSPPSHSRTQKVLLGVSAGIAAYKAAELVRGLRKGGAEVRVVMTPAAHAFITPLTLQALSGAEVRTDLLDPEAEAGMGHIELARWADLVLIAPASADIMARLAAGLADDLLTTLVLASSAPLVLAPAMNQRMWLHPATRENAARLTSRGVVLLGPAEGEQACGDWGPGRMLEPAEILKRLDLGRVPDLTGIRVLVTAGPTREAIDPVRYVGNRSSGRMGYALAQALVARGAAVRLVSGPTSLAPPPGVDLVPVESALEMREAVMAGIAGCRIFIAAAAVADYRPAAPATAKIKKDQAERSLRLVRNPDILGEVAALPDGPFTVGFAAETDRVEEHAVEKLERKGLDMIAANLVGGAAGGFERAENALTVLWAGGRESFPLMPKTRLAVALADLIAERYLAQATDQDP
jgi:phosphopantothenoylcysteine decarboxylase/phosphopantothenate--cysteine ligase